ncbi:hypothetical protein J2X20_005186 [Pelomonas saccharophila]|uniref:Secreted protein n=1 Tax=Roseateles saccharophilus TaxID=304 RepID=A0ABU1YUV3_ROSSA|nr:hypothetical protein [Roseateles saccharophilus]MDR7272503.1 hypothetical protein [Roseateles saccharophilus]
MKILLATLACLSCIPALADDADMHKARQELRAGCAQSYASFIAHHPAGNAPEYRGDKQPGDSSYYADAKPCSEAHLAAYLDKADPALVMRAYPSAAGRPKAKTPATSASAPAKP